MNNNILSALTAINVAELDRASWIAVGMALKHEGFPVSVWDDWSQNDERYHPGECERIWNGFHGISENSVEAESQQIDVWICPECGAENKISRVNCSECGKQRD